MEAEQNEVKGQLPNQKGQCYCQKQRKWYKEVKFYQYPDGSKTKMCKSCLTLHVDNFDPNTFVWLLKEMDVPYVPSQWNNLRDAAFARDPKKMNGMSVFGKYLSKMKLKQWKDYRWADSERIQEQRGQVLRERQQEEQQEREAYTNELKQKLAAGEINQAEYKTLMPTQIQRLDLAPADGVNLDGAVSNAFDEEQFISQDQLPDIAADLSLDDKKYLATKWGRLYKPSELVQLEQTYTEMDNSFAIEDADSRNTLIAICKVNLKMNQSLDTGDIDGFQKLSRVYESLRKSANFTAAQNKAGKGKQFDSVGSIVAFCEKESGIIPEYKLDAPRDVIDKIIKDLKAYNESLIREDPALSREIEDYLRKRSIQDEMKRDRQRAAEKGEILTLSDQDVAQFERFKYNEKQKDKQGGDL